MLFRLLMLVLLGSLLLQCSGDSEVREKAKAEAEQLAQQTANTPPSQPTTIPDGLEPTPPTTGETFTMTLGKVEVAAGEEACIPVTVRGFNQLIGLQFSIRWNRDELKYTAIKNMDLTDLGPQNFGDTHNELGVVALSWIHQTLQGITLPADSRIFDICFIPQTEAGSKVEVRLESAPVAFEAINVREDILQFAPINGEIRVKAE